MGCSRCGAVGQQGRFCVGCGAQLSRQLQPMGGAAGSPPAGSAAGEDLTQPVLRLAHRRRPAVPRTPAR
jgi:hypothetical protein